MKRSSLVAVLVLAVVCGRLTSSSAALMDWIFADSFESGNAGAWREGARVVAAVADEDGLPPIQETYAQALLLLGRVDEARPVVRRVLDSGWPLDPTTARLCKKHGIKID